MSTREKLAYDKVEDSANVNNDNGQKKPWYPKVLLLLVLFVIAIILLCIVGPIFLTKLKNDFPESFSQDSLENELIPSYSDSDEDSINDEDKTVNGEPYFKSIDQNHKRCSGHLIPGLERMQRGIDITTLDLYPSKDLLTHANGFLRPIFEYSCGQDKIWRHPNFAEPQYSRPDQIVAINTVPSGGEHAQTQFYSNLQSYKKKIAISLGLGAEADFEVFGGGLSASGGYKHMQKQVLKSNRSAAEVSAYVGAFQVDFLTSSQMRLSSEVSDYIHNKLGKTYEEASEKYDEFINSFGTHYFESALFGGCLHQKSFISNDYVYESSELELKAQLKLSLKIFFVNINGHVNVSYSTKEASEKFKRHTESDIQYYGGYSDFSIQGIDQQGMVSSWLNSVNKDPWPFSGKLVPIERLIADVHTQNQVKIASMLKRAKAYVDDIRHAVDLSNVRLDKSQMDSLKRIDDYLHSKHVVKSLANITSFVGEIDQLFETIQQIRDRALLDEYSNKLSSIRDILNCKLTLAELCNRMLYSDLREQMRKFQEVLWKMDRSRLNQKLNTDSVHAVISRAMQIVAFHSTKTTICAFDDAKCQRCFEDKVEMIEFCQNPKALAVVTKTI